MDQETLRMIARLKITAARAGQPVDVVRFASDRPYAKDVLKKFADSAAEDGVVLALQLMEKLQMTVPAPRESPAPPVRAAPPPAAGGDKPAVEERYVGRLR